MGRINVLVKAVPNVRYLRFTMITPQVFDIGGTCPGPFNGCDFLDVSEVTLYGTS